MVKKKVTVSIFTFILTSIIVTTAYAATLGYLSYWDSDSSHIGRWNTTRYVYTYAVDGTLQGALPTYESHARSQWNNAGVTSYSSTSSSAVIKVFGGTYENLKAMEPNISSTNTGYTVSTSVNEGEWVAQGVYKTGKRYTSSKVYIVYKYGKSGNGYKKTTTHELGHALGWSGHSDSSADIMYSSASEVTTLTTTDKRHLKQVY